MDNYVRDMCFNKEQYKRILANTKKLNQNSFKQK